jgi:hypothetical protein
MSLEADLYWYGWTKEQMATALLQKAKFEPGPVSWTSYKTTTWVRQGGSVRRLEFGTLRHDTEKLGAADVHALADHLYRGLDLNGWPAYCALPGVGRYQRAGPAPRCLQGLHALYEAGVFCDQEHWRVAARRGLAYALQNVRSDVPTFALPDHACGPMTDACVLHVAALVGAESSLLGATRDLAARLSGWITPDGAVLAEGAIRSDSNQDFLPGVTILALARYIGRTQCDLNVDWRAIRTFYRRRFRLLHPWGLALWHSIAWSVIAAVTGDQEDAAFSFEIADWLGDQQLRADGSFLTNLDPTGQSFHTACAARGVAAAWQLALARDDVRRAASYRRVWQRAMEFVSRLIVRPEDTFWMPEPTMVVGAVRNSLTNYELRADQNGYTILALIGGLSTESSGTSIHTNFADFAATGVPKR